MILQPLNKFVASITLSVLNNIYIPTVMKYTTMYLISLCILATIIVVPIIEAAHILAVETVGGKSHWNFMKAILQTLIDHGHEVTVFTPFLEGNRTNYTEIDTSQVTPMHTNKGITDVKNWQSPLNLITNLYEMTIYYYSVIINYEKMQHILMENSKLKFDVLFVQPLATEDISLIATKLGIPLIYVIPTTSFGYLEWETTGQILNPAYVGHLLSEYSHPHKYLAKRIFNFILFFYENIRIKYDENISKFKSLKNYQRIKSTKPLIIFQNTHHITDPSKPLMPSIIRIGGIHIKPHTSIPSDILEYIENSPHGVIYFSFGSVLITSTLPHNVQKVFKETLAKLPQRVLWKYEGQMKDKPDNIMIKKWFPQRDILLHPNVKLFISHGGISGLYEAVDAGIPILGFPLFFDQPKNVDNLVEAGMALSMDISSITRDTFYNAINNLINNKTFIKNAKITSEIFKDRPMTPKQSVVYWTEYVLRHKDSSHLNSDALDLNWYQYFLLDIFAEILLVLFVLYILYKSLI